MANYVREQSFGELIRNTFKIYGSHFLSVVLTYLILVFPWQMLYSFGIHEQEPIIMLIGFFLVTTSSLFATAVITLLISDVCLGNKISLPRYFRRAFGAILGKLLVTNLLQSIIIVIGYIVFIIPGLLFMVWFMYAGSIVVLEEKWGFQALKRSRMLGKGYYMRILGIFLILVAIVIIIVIFLGTLAGIAMGGHVERLGFMIFQNLIQSVTMPISVIAIVLMYYDLRARKEAFNNEVLAEELRR